MDNIVQNGTTKWFDRRKGYGFLTREDGTDFFVHYSGIEMEGYKTLEKGQKVKFQIKEDPKGASAVNVIPIL